MRKIFWFFIVTSFSSFVIGIVFLNVRIRENVNSDQLDPFVYNTENHTMDIISGLLGEGLFFEGFEGVADATRFLNAFIFHTIRENINEDYDPLNDACEIDSCFYVLRESAFKLDYVFAENFDEDIFIVISLKRTGFPNFETAIRLTVNYGYEPSLLGGEVFFEIEEIFIGKQNISKDNVSRLMNLIGEEEINQNLSYGHFSIESLKLTIPLLDLITQQEPLPSIPLP